MLKKDTTLPLVPKFSNIFFLKRARPEVFSSRIGHHPTIPSRPGHDLVSVMRSSVSFDFETSPDLHQQHSLSRFEIKV